MNTPPEDKLDRALEQLPRSIEPGHDLWPGIAARIVRHEHHGASRHAWSYAGAVAAVLVVAISISWLSFGVRTPLSGNQAVSTVVPVTNPAADTDAAPRAEFAAQLAGNHALPPKSRLALLANLRLLHDSILRTQAELKKYPDDVNLQALLFNLYQQEAQLISEAQQAQIQTSTRNTI